MLGLNSIALKYPLSKGTMPAIFVERQVNRKTNVVIKKVS